MRKLNQSGRCYHVIGTEAGPWVLTFGEGFRTLEECRSAIRWQDQGGYVQPGKWVIAYWDAEAQIFRERGGDRTFDVVRGPLAEKAFARFMAELPKREG